MKTGIDSTRNRARVAVARALLAAVLVLTAGCSHAPPRVDTKASPAEPSLAERLKTMSAADQLAALRPLAAGQPSDAQIAFLTGNAYYELGTGLGEGQPAQAIAYFDSAVGEYRRAVDADSTMSKAWVNMGLAFEAAGKHIDARKAFQSAIAVNPRDVLAYCHFGYMEQQSGNVAEAVRLYQKALEIDPGSAQAHYNLGLAFADARLFQEALVEWQAAMKLDPDGELGKTAAENVKIIRQYLDAKP